MTIDSLIESSCRNAQYEHALNLIENHLKQNVADVNKKALLLLKACEINLKLGNADASKDKIEAAEAILATIRNINHDLQFRYALQKSHYFIFIGRNADAHTWLKKAEQVTKNTINNMPGEAARIKAELGAYHFNNANYLESVKQYKLATALNKKNLQADKITSAYHAACLARSLWFINETAQADQLADSCLAFLETVADPLHPALLEYYFVMADYYNNKSKLDIAENLLLPATRIIKKTYPFNHYTYGILYYLKNSVEYKKRNYETVIYNARRIANITESYPFLIRYRISNYRLMASTYYNSIADYLKTIEYANLVLGIESIKSYNTAYANYLIGLSYRGLNNMPLAVTYLEKAINTLPESQSLIDLSLCSRIYRELATTVRLQGNFAIEFHYFQEALSASGKISPRNGLTSTIYLLMSQSYFFNNDFVNALKTIQLSIIKGCRTFSDTSCLANPDFSDIFGSYWLIESFSTKAYLLYQFYEKDKRNLKYLETALACQEISARLLERILVGIDDENSGIISIDWEVLALNNAVSYSTLLYLHTNDPVYAEKAFEYAEKSKMQYLLIKTLKKKHLQSSGIPDTLLNQEEELNHEIHEIENRLDLNDKKGIISEYNKDFLEKLTVLYDRRDELINHLEEDYPAYYKAKYGSHVAGMEKIQHMLKDDQVLLEYQLLNTELITFIITRNNFSIHYQLIDKQVPDNIALLRNIVASDPSQSNSEAQFQSFVNASHYLYTILIEPVYDKLKNKRITLIPHHALTMLPFEILISEKPEKNSRASFKSLNYFIKEFPIVYAYSANLLMDNNQEKKYGSRTAIFLPDYSSYDRINNQNPFLLLKGAAEEAAAIRRISHGRLFKGSQADETTFKRKASGFRIIHIASHTLLDDKNPSLSGIVMTAPNDTIEDGYLYSYELSQMNLNAQLIVLSGCNTGYGRLRKNEGLISIARSFFYTGVRTVTFTLWTVADKSGSELISSFYSGIRHHQSLDMAMRNAKLDFIENADPVKAHPFYWASYVIVGKSDKIRLGGFPKWPLITFATLLVAFMSVMIYRKFRT